MVTSQNGILFIRKNEGVRLSVYNDNGHPAIGYGHDLTQHEIVSGVYVNGITIDQAAALIQADLTARYEPTVNELAPQANQNQFDALVDFVFNAGVGNFASSTMLRLLNQGQFVLASAEFDKWDHAGGQVVAGLLRRRQAETNEFESGE